MLRRDFVPVAIDQWYTRSQQDVEGRFYRQIIQNSPRNDPNKTTQGFYVASPGGQLIGYNNNRTPDRVRKFMEDSLSRKVSMVSKPLMMKKVDEQFHPQLPPGAIVARVNSKILNGYKPSNRSFDEVFQNAVGRDNLWVTAEEQARLAENIFPKSLMRKIARFNLVDNTRGEPPMWEGKEIKSLEISLTAEGEILGEAHLETRDGKRGYMASLRGIVESKSGRLVRFDLVSKGKFWGSGPYTKRAPKGKFDFVVAIRLADGTDVSDDVVPQALKAAGRQSYRNP